MKCRMTLLAVCLAVALPAPGQNTTAPARAKVTNDQISHELDVQIHVSGEMARLVQEFGELVDDVGSNQVFNRVDGGALEATKNSLGSTDKDRVRVAASELRKAVDNSASRGTHVKKAAVQVNLAKTELTDLLRQANGLMLEDTIVQEIRDIMRDQQSIARKTAQSGREQLQQQPISTNPAQLAQEQRQIAKRVKKLMEAIKEAIKEELTSETRERLQHAQKIAEQKRLEPKEQKTVDDLDKEDLMAAFQVQQETLDILAEMADTISDVQHSASDAAIDALKNLLEDQKKLREKTESMSPEEFEKEAADLELEQLNLANELPEDSEAAEPMEDAADSLEMTDQDSAVTAQMEAEENLAQAIEEEMGPGPGIPGAKGDAGLDDKGDGDGKKDKEGRGGKGKAKKGKNKNDKGKKPGPPKNNAAVEPVLAKNMPKRSNTEPQAGERKFEKSKVEGRLPQGSDSTWISLNRKERNSLSENFARELPREYRDMLKVYYEELSK